MKVAACVLVVLVLGPLAAHAADARPPKHERRHGASDTAKGPATGAGHLRQGPPLTHGALPGSPVRLENPVRGGGKGAARVNGTDIRASSGDLNGTKIWARPSSLNGTAIGARR